MKKTLISLCVFWLVCYALLFIFNGVVLPPGAAGNNALKSQEKVGSAETAVAIFVSSHPTAPYFVTRQSNLAGLFLRPILPASMVTVFGGLAIACGYRLVGFGYRGHPTPQK